MVKSRIAGAAWALLLLAQAAPAQEMIQPQRIIHCHTAGILPRGTYALEFSVYPNGDIDLPGSGMLVGVTMGLLGRLNVGISYGGDAIIGRDAPRFNPHLGALIKYRVFEESYVWPAFVLGYDHQGFGGIDGDYVGYLFKSPGFFLAASKNYLFLGKVQFGVHAGINYSLEESKTVKWPNAYCGADLGINEELSLAAEYDLALNARDPGATETHYDDPLRGFFNIGLRWSFSASLSLEFDVKDILHNKVTALPDNKTLGWDREMKLAYLTRF
jgi:hypothetical protein